jgi:hypothetical protein
MLARTIGLHQTQAASSQVSPEESEERFKVLRSLYLLDKNCAISRGSICWLPSYDCDVSFLPCHADPMYAARIKLATLQEEIYRLFHAAGSQKQSVAKHKASLSRVDQRLERWANAHDIYDSRRPRDQNVDLKLDFFAARITAFHGSSDADHIRRTLNDARASCLLLLTSLDERNTALIGWLDGLLLSMHSLSLLEQSDQGTDLTAFPLPKDEKTNPPVPSRFHSLLSSFPVPAFFLLAKNILWSVSGDSAAQVEVDLNLLQMVCACFKTLDSQIPADNYTRRVGRTFERLLEIVQFLVNPRPSPLEAAGSFHTNTSPTVPGVANVPDFGLTTSPISPVSWDGFSNKTTSTVATNTNSPETVSTMTSPNLLTPADMSYLGQQQCLVRQSTYPSRPWRCPVGLPSRKRRHLGGDAEDVTSMDSHSEAFIVDLLASNPEITFDMPYNPVVGNV